MSGASLYTLCVGAFDQRGWHLWSYCSLKRWLLVCFKAVGSIVELSIRGEHKNALFSRASLL